MDVKLEELKNLLNKKNVYTLISIKEIIQIYDDKDLTIILSNLISEGIIKIKSKSRPYDFKYIIKAIDLLNLCLNNLIDNNMELKNKAIELRCHIATILSKCDKNSEYMDLRIKKFYQEIMNNLDMLIEKINCLSKVEDLQKDKIDACSLIEYLIFEVKDYDLVVSLLIKFPSLTKLEVLNNNIFIRQLIESYICEIKKDNNDELIIYYNRIIDYFISSKIIKITKDYKNKIINNLLNEIDSLKREKISNSEYYMTVFYLQELVNKLKNIQSFDYKNTVSNINYKYGIQSFSENALNEIEKKVVINNENYADLRDKTIISIDEIGTHSFDDGFSCEKLENGNILLGIYITDVDFYIKKGSLLDIEALKRAQTICTKEEMRPMFPKQISNDICSLNCNSIKPVIAFMIEFSDSLEIIDKKVFQAIVQMTANFNYDKFNILLTKNPTKNLESLRLMTAIAEKLRKDNPNKSIYHTVKEIKKSLNQDISENYLYSGTIGQTITQELKILVSTLIAEHFYDNKLPFIYRVNNFNADSTLINKIHEATNHNEKLNEIINVINQMYNPSTYSIDNTGHFGLSSRAYGHSTIPLRSYASLTNLRLIKAMMIGNVTDRVVYQYEDELPELVTYLNKRISLNKAYVSEIEQAYLLQKRLTKRK